MYTFFRKLENHHLQTSPFIHHRLSNKSTLKEFKNNDGDENKKYKFLTFEFRIRLLKELFNQFQLIFFKNS